MRARASVVGGAVAAGRVDRGGRGYAAGRGARAILDSYPMPVFCGDTYIWPDLKAKATKTSAPRVYEQGRVMGGGSSINVQSANRGLPRDYDEWAANGAPGWAMGRRAAVFPQARA